MTEKQDMTEDQQQRDDWGRHWHLDRRLNLGHLMTTIVLALSAFAYVNAQDKRLTVLEERQAAYLREVAAQERQFSQLAADLKNEVSGSVGQLRVAIDRLNDRLERFTERPQR